MPDIPPPHRLYYYGGTHDTGSIKLIIVFQEHNQASHIQGCFIQFQGDRGPRAIATVVLMVPSFVQRCFGLKVQTTLSGTET